MKQYDFESVGAKMRKLCQWLAILSNQKYHPGTFVWCDMKQNWCDSYNANCPYKKPRNNNPESR